MGTNVADAASRSTRREARYDAFISYSRKDKAFARDLEKALESYRPPRDLNVPQRRLEVFRDETDFRGSEYYQSLDRSLGESATLIVICSPSARQSTYVDDEVRRFAARNGADRIIPVLLDGVPNNEVEPGSHGDAAFPPALCELLAMPLAIPYRGFDTRRDRVHRGAFHDAWCTLLADIYDIPRDQLDQREKRRQARTRRNVLITAAAVITVLSAALVFALISRRDAIAQREVAENSQRVAEAAREQAETETKKALSAAEAERLAAITARRQTAERLAVQAMQALDGAPGAALALAERAVETFHGRRDPLVPEALSALQHAVLALLGSRPLVPSSPAQTAVAYSPDHEWVAIADNTVRAGRAGSESLQALSFPGRIGRNRPTWGSSVKLALVPDGLVVVRDFDDVSGRWNAALAFWPINHGELAARPTLVETFDIEGWSSEPIRSSPDGKWVSWVSWSEGRRKTFLRRLAGSSAHAITCEALDRCASIFDEDGRHFWFAGLGTVRRFALPADDRQGLVSVDTLATRPFSIETLVTSSVRSRLALLGRNGEVEWWDLSASPPVRHEVPNIFSAYGPQLSVERLEPEDAHRTIEFNDVGTALLVSVVEAKSGDFGVAAVLELDSSPQWVPLLHQRDSRESTSRSITYGTTYSVKQSAELGVASTFWAGRGGAGTLGQDGTLRTWLVEDRSSKLLATSVTAAAGGRWLVAGGSDGTIRVWNDPGKLTPSLVLSGHDAPIRDLSISEAGNRIVSRDESGEMRLWDLSHPTVSPETTDAVSREGRWLASSDGVSHVRIWDVSRLDRLEPNRAPGIADANAVAFDPESPWMATMHHNVKSPGSVIVRLWRTDADFQRPEVERRWTLKGAQDFWRWSTSFSLSVKGTRAVIAFSGEAIDTQLWLADLHSHADPLPVLGSGEAIVHGRPGQPWLVTNRAGPGSAARVVLRRIDSVGERPIPIRLGSSPFLAEVSRDARWLILSASVFRKYLIDVSGGADIPPRVFDLGEPLAMAFADDRPPLWGTGDGRLWGLFPRNGNSTMTPVALPGVKLTAVQWDSSGHTLVVADDRQRVWLVNEPDMAAGKLAEQVLQAAKSTLLPPASRVASVVSLFPFIESDWIFGETNDKRVLAWHRDRSGKWNAPVTFPLSMIRLDRLSHVHFDSRRSHAFFTGTRGMALLSFDPDTLLALGRQVRGIRRQ